MHQNEDGLEILVGGGDDDGAWLPIPHSISGDCFMIIFDDALGVLTNGQVPPTMHRVRRGARERFSLISFLALDTLLTPPDCYGARRQTDKQLEDWYNQAIAVSGAFL